MLNKIIAIVAVFSGLLALMPHKIHDVRISSAPQVLGLSVNSASITTAAPELAGRKEFPEISAKSALAVDLSSGSILYTKNFDERLPIASLTKLMTALVVLDLSNMSNEVTVIEDDTKLIGTLMGLAPDERILVADLLQGMLISSSNDAAKVLARYVGGSEAKFVDMMNRKGKSLHLTNTNFANPIGFDDENNYSTALDLVKLSQEFINQAALTEIVKIKETNVYSTDEKYKHRLRSTNKLLLEDEEVVGIKTGFTDEAKGNLIVRKQRGNADVLTVVLGSENREDDSRKLLDWIFTSYRW